MESVSPTCHSSYVNGKYPDTKGLKMDMIITAKDFEHLTTNQMEWNNVDWEKQLQRFIDLDSKPAFEYIFWVDSAASLIMARHFLIENGHPFKQSYDEGADQYALITDYVGSWERVDA